MTPRQTLLTLSRRVASAAIIPTGQQPAPRSGIVLPKRWIPQSSRRTLSSNTKSHERAARTQRASVLIVSASALCAMLLYHETPARMDSLRDGADTVKKSESAEKPPIALMSRSLEGQRTDLDSRLLFYETLDADPGDAAADLPEEHAIITTAPNVPPPITRDHPVLLHVSLTACTKLTQLTSQYKYEQWTFNKTVPGPFIRARAGDTVSLTITNHDPAGNPHNIDCHAFTGPGGGATITTTEENESRTARFKLLHPGIYIYHCAAAPVPVHIANGMYGLLYVQPADDPLPAVDREYYVMQSEFYHEPPEVGDDGRPSGTVEFSYPGGLREEPSVVVFNGSDAALTRDAPLTARTGETVRIFFGNAGPNLMSSFHVIGSNFRRAWRDGDVVSPPGRFVSTVVVPPGGATVVDLKMVVPGTYALVDHAIFRMDKGAVGFLNVSGRPRPDICGSLEGPGQACVGCKLHA